MPNVSKKKKITGCLERSECPITNTLDLIGDKWTLLVIRDMMFLKKKSFNEFLESREGIATNILTDRLKRLEENGIIEKRPYKKIPARYEYTLTRRGAGLRSVLIEMIEWGQTAEALTQDLKKSLTAAIEHCILDNVIRLIARFNNDPRSYNHQGLTFIDVAANTLTRLKQITVHTIESVGQIKKIGEIIQHFINLLMQK